MNKFTISPRMPAQHACKNNSQHQQTDKQIKFILFEREAYGREYDAHNWRGNKQRDTRLNDGPAAPGDHAVKNAAGCADKFGYAGKFLMVGHLAPVPPQVNYTADKYDTHGYNYPNA